jgi:hypothetical protein
MNKNNTQISSFGKNNELESELLIIDGLWGNIDPLFDKWGRRTISKMLPRKSSKREAFEGDSFSCSTKILR